MPVLRKLLFFLSYLGLLGAGIFLLFGPKLRVEQISCQQDGGSCPAEYLEKLQAWRGKSLLLTDFAKQAQDLQKNWPQLQKITVQKKLPNQLRVELSFGQPAYVVAFPGAVFRVVSTQGLVIQELSASPSAMTTLNLPPELKSEFPVGQKIEEQWQNELREFVTALTLNKIIPQQITLKNKTEVQLLLPNNQEVFLLLSEAPSALPKLVAIEQAELNKQLPVIPKTIDLRFKYPVIKSDPAASLSASVTATPAASPVATKSATPAARR